MNLTDDETLKFLRGSPVFIDDICAVYCATLGEIIDIGYSKFQQYLGVVTSTKPTVKNSADDEMARLLDKLTDFQYLLMLSTIDAEMNKMLKEAFHFFTHENVSFSLEPPQIIVGDIESQRILTEKHFVDFQRLIKRMYFLEQEGEEIIINPDDNPALVAMKKKMLENRAKVRKAKAKKAEREKNDLKLSDLIGSLTINHCGLNIENIWNITYYAFHDQLKRMGWRDQFDINNRAALAGAKMKKGQLKHWMRSIASTDKS